MADSAEPPSSSDPSSTATATKLKNFTRTCRIYDTKQFFPLLDKVTLCPFMTAQEVPEPPQVQSSKSSTHLFNKQSDALYCSCCDTTFTDQDQQRAHYKLDWHRYNLKQQLANKKAITEEQFTQLADDDLSSISGSESENEDLDEPKTIDEQNEQIMSCLIAKSSRVLFNNSEGKVISLHRSILLNKKERDATDEYLVQLIKAIPHRNHWLIIMVGGGHFAAALFIGEKIQLHKTFHMYIVRSKQGSTQSSRDNKGSHCKSAGASLRRSNELSMSQQVQDLIKSWGPELNRADLIFYRAVGKSNIAMLFSCAVPICSKTDPRLRKIPFTTKRATLNEVKRIHELLCTVFIYDSNEIFKATFYTPPPPRATKVEEDKNQQKSGSPKKTEKAKETENSDNDLPNIVQRFKGLSISESEETALVEETQEKKELVPNKKKKKKKPPRKKDKLNPQVKEFWNKIHGAWQQGDSETLKTLLQDRVKEEVTDKDVASVLNHINLAGETILHNTSANGDFDTVRILMLHGANPCIRDKKGKTPFDHAPDKSMKIAFRKFRAEYPDFCNYDEAHIPSALTDEQVAELIEQERLEKIAKEIRDNEKRLEMEALRREEEEKARFLKLSDREKMAIAAEKRILSGSSGTGSLSVVRCYSCAVDMTGKVPFEYNKFRFCTMNCLKVHRMKGKQT